MTRGLTTLTTVLAGLAIPVTTTSLGTSAKLPRSSVFEIARKLQAAGFLDRDANGALTPGPEAVRFALAAHDLGRIAGRAEALLTLLRDETEGHAALVIGKRVLLRATACSEPKVNPDFDASIGGARLQLTLRRAATLAQRAAAAAVFGRVAATLHDE